MEEKLKEQLNEYQTQIDKLEKDRKALFIVGISLLGLGFTLLVAMFIVIGVGGDNLAAAFIILLVSSILCIIGGTVLFFVRSLVVDVKLANRRRIINKEYSIEREKNHPSNENHKLGL